MYLFKEDGSFSITFDGSLYRLESIKKACYKFLDRCSVVLASEGSNMMTANFMMISGVKDKASIELLVQEICNEVLDQDLRETIAEETEPLRNLILAHAFSQTSLVNQG